MIRPRLLPPRLAVGLLLLAGAGVCHTRGEKAAPADHPEKAAPEEPPPPTPAPAKAQKVAPGHPAAAAPAPAAARPKTAAPAKSHAADEIASLLKLGPSLTDRGDYPAAEIAFYQVLNRPRIPENDTKAALLGLARMHRKQGTFTKAIAVYERFLKDYPNDERSPDALLDLGRTLRALGLHRMAINRFYSVLNSTLKLTGGSFEHYQLLAKTAQFEIAQTHFDAGEFSDANKFFTRLRLLDLAPGDRARAHFMSAYSQRLQGNREGAITTLRSFIEQSPDDENVPEARYLLAITLRDLQRSQEALTATLELLRAEKSRTATDPKRWAYWQRRTGNQLANDFYETGDTVNAHSIYTGLLELSPEPGWRLPLLYQIALCLERLGQPERARQTYESIATGAGSPPSAEFAELAKMAAWRLEHLNWRGRVEQQVSTHFTTKAGQTAATAAPPAAANRTSATP